MFENKYIQQRIEKADKLRELGYNPYSNDSKKDTTIAKFLSLVYRINPETRVALVAPTGKAAARIKESILIAKSQIPNLDENTKVLFDNINSSTIHRLLAYKSGTRYFKHHAQNPLNYDIVIVDESSMIGVSLMAKLISAVPVNKKIIFLGDKNQLTSVEAGSVFGDICQTQSSSNLFSQSKLDFLNQFSEFDITKHLIQKPNFLSDHLVELQKSYRFDKNKGIGLISHAALSGHLDKLKIESFVNDNQVQIFTDYQTSDFESFFQLFIKFFSFAYH